ncbi:MAG: lipopolysaccharide biosynthesis protein [Planctomycetaceae bacterium]|nr:lipopolysaccharide biosynthesis protein [Planctomycetaceae bacterium]
MDSPSTSNKKQFLTHTFIYGFGELLNQFAPVVLLPLYTNYLTPGDYGITEIIDRTAYLINTLFVVNGIRLAALTFYRQANSEEERRKVAVTLSLFLWVMVLVAILSTFVLAVPLNAFLGADNPKLLVFGLVTALLGSLTTVPLALMQARLESLRFVLTNMAMLVIRVSLCVYFVAWLEWGIWGVFLSQCIVSVVFSILLMSRELAIGSIHPDFSKIGKVWAFCWPLIPAGLMGWVYGNADRFFIIKYNTYATNAAALEAIGFYSLASRLTRIVPLFGAAAIQQVWTAKMYGVFKQPNASKVFGDFAVKMNLVFSFGTLVLCVFAKDLITAICDTSYLKAVPLVLPLAISGWFVNFYLQMENTYYITRTTRYKPWVTATMLPIILVFMFLLVPRWNVLGAACALMCSSIVSCLIRLGVTQRIFRVDYQYFNYLRLFLLSAACYFLSLQCGDGVLQNTLTPEQMGEMSKWERIPEILGRFQYLPLLGKSMILLLWVGGVWVSGILTPEDKSLIRGVLQSGYGRLLKISKFFNANQS